jgi:RimJ/RimL family protein N-acetyltransferase
VHLHPLALDDAAEVLRVYGDPDTWENMPGSSFTDLADARTHINVSMRSFLDHGLGTWAIRLGDSIGAGLETGRFVGTGGVRFLDDGAMWNLGYRLERRAWGYGLATEVCRAALAAAAEVAPQHPITARVFSRNSASVAVLEKVGLELVWEGCALGETGASAGGLSSRRIYADRELTASSLTWLQYAV